MQNLTRLAKRVVRQIETQQVAHVSEEELADLVAARPDDKYDEDVKDVVAQMCLEHYLKVSVDTNKRIFSFRAK